VLRQNDNVDIAFMKTNQFSYYLPCIFLQNRPGHLAYRYLKQTNKKIEMVILSVSLLIRPRCN